ncbi:MAG: flagellar hook-length control protein FliK [Candidatus Cloacimonetes bacterium]|nr:flagellar hook-length control protein FliK [Candidatus Cloacimonadota bacterium]
MSHAFAAVMNQIVYQQKKISGNSHELSALSDFNKLFSSFRIQSVDNKNIAIAKNNSLSVRDLTSLIKEKKVEVFVKENGEFINIKNIAYKNMNIKDKEIFFAPRNTTREFLSNFADKKDELEDASSEKIINTKGEIDSEKKQTEIAITGEINYNGISMSPLIKNSSEKMSDSYFDTLRDENSSADSKLPSQHSINAEGFVSKLIVSHSPIKSKMQNQSETNLILQKNDKQEVVAANTEMKVKNSRQSNLAEQIPVTENISKILHLKSASEKANILSGKRENRVELGGNGADVSVSDTVKDFSGISSKIEVNSLHNSSFDKQNNNYANIVSESGNFDANLSDSDGGISLAGSGLEISKNTTEKEFLNLNIEKVGEKTTNKVSKLGKISNLNAITEKTEKLINPDSKAENAHLLNNRTKEVFTEFGGNTTADNFVNGTPEITDNKYDTHLGESTEDKNLKKYMDESINATTNTSTIKKDVSKGIFESTDNLNFVKHSDMGKLPHDVSRIFGGKAIYNSNITSNRLSTNSEAKTILFPEVTQKQNLESLSSKADEKYLFTEENVGIRNPGNGDNKASMIFTDIHLPLKQNSLDDFEIADSEKTIVPGKIGTEKNIEFGISAKNVGQDISFGGRVDSETSKLSKKILSANKKLNLEEPVILDDKPYNVDSEITGKHTQSTAKDNFTQNSTINNLSLAADGEETEKSSIMLNRQNLMKTNIGSVGKEFSEQTIQSSSESIIVGMTKKQTATVPENLSSANNEGREGLQIKTAVHLSRDTFPKQSFDLTKPDKSISVNEAEFVSSDTKNENILLTSGTEKSQNGKLLHGEDYSKTETNSKIQSINRIIARGNQHQAEQVNEGKFTDAIFAKILQKPAVANSEKSKSENYPDEQLSILQKNTKTNMEDSSERIFRNVKNVFAKLQGNKQLNNDVIGKEDSNSLSLNKESTVIDGTDRNQNTIHGETVQQERNILPNNNKPAVDLQKNSFKQNLIIPKDGENSYLNKIYNTHNESLKESAISAETGNLPRSSSSAENLIGVKNNQLSEIKSVLLNKSADIHPQALSELHSKIQNKVDSLFTSPNEEKVSQFNQTFDYTKTRTNERNEETQTFIQNNVTKEVSSAKKSDLFAKNDDLSSQAKMVLTEEKINGTEVNGKNQNSSDQVFVKKYQPADIINEFKQNNLTASSLSEKTSDTVTVGQREISTKISGNAPTQSSAVAEGSTKNFVESHSLYNNQTNVQTNKPGNLQREIASETLNVAEKGDIQSEMKPNNSIRNEVSEEIISSESVNSLKTDIIDERILTDDGKTFFTGKSTETIVPTPLNNTKSEFISTTMISDNLPKTSQVKDILDGALIVNSEDVKNWLSEDNSINSAEKTDINIEQKKISDSGFSQVVAEDKKGNNITPEMNQESGEDYNELFPKAQEAKAERVVKNISQKDESVTLRNSLKQPVTVKQSESDFPVRERINNLLNNPEFSDSLYASIQTQRENGKNMILSVNNDKEFILEPEADKDIFVIRERNESMSDNEEEQNNSNQFNKNENKESNSKSEVSEETRITFQNQRFNSHLTSRTEPQQEAQPQRFTDLYYLKEHFLEEVKNTLKFELGVKESLRWAKFSLQVDKIGIIETTVKSKDDSLTVVITAESAEKMKIIQHNLIELKPELQKIGFNNVNLEFSFDEHSDNQKANQQSEKQLSNNLRGTRKPVTEEIGEQPVLQQSKKYGYNTVEYIA